MFKARKKQLNIFIRQDSLPVHLYVNEIIDFSSQYGKEGSKSYAICNLRGQPNHYPRYGDFIESCVLVTH